MSMDRDILIDRAQHWGAVSGHKVAYSFLRDGELVEDALDYAGLDRRARSLGALLQQRCSRGSRALLLFPSGIDFVVAFVACLYAGVIAVPVNNPKPKQLHWQRLATIVEDAGVEIVLTTAENLVKSGDWLDHMEAFAELPKVAVDALETDVSDLWRDPGVDRGDIAFLQYTSGSTGTPKGVMVSHGNLMHNLDLIEKEFGHSHDSVFVTWLPLFHDLGLIGNMLQALYLGASCYLMTPMAFLQRPIRWLRAISSYGGTTSMAPNFAYERCLDIPEDERQGLDLSSWRVALNGAEAIRARTVIDFEKAYASYGFSPSTSFPAYGMAEITLIATTADKNGLAVVVHAQADAYRDGRFVPSAPFASGSMQLVSSGRAGSDLEIAIVDPDSLERCAPDVVGEVWIGGGSVCQGYWNRPRESERTFAARTSDGSGPFLRTGDMAFEHEGEIFISGRLKEMIIIRGQNYYPQDIENLLQLTSPVLREDSGAAFAADVDGREVLVLAQEVERTALRNLDVDALCATIRSAVADGFDLQVHAIVLIKPATLPKTSSGKIQRRLCRQIFQSGEKFEGEVARDVAVAQEPPAEWEDARLPPGADADQIRGLIIARLSQLLGMPASRIDLGASFSDLGLDSSVAVGFSAEVGNWVGRRQDSSLLWIYPDVESLCEHVVAELAAGYEHAGSAVAV